MMSCPAPIAPSPFTLALSADAGDGGSFAAFSAQCAALPARPLTAGSYTDPETQLTVHWPEGWTLTTIGDNATFVTLTTPITWVPTGSTTALQDQASFTLSVFGYGNANQVPQAVPDAISAAAHAEGAGMALTLAGHPGAIWWRLAPPAQPECPAPCLTVPPSPRNPHDRGPRPVHDGPRRRQTRSGGRPRRFGARRCPASASLLRHRGDDPRGDAGPMIRFRIGFVGSGTLGAAVFLGVMPGCGSGSNRAGNESGRDAREGGRCHGCPGRGGRKRRRRNGRDTKPGCPGWRRRGPRGCGLRRRVVRHGASLRVLPVPRRSGWHFPSLPAAPTAALHRRARCVRDRELRLPRPRSGVRRGRLRVGPRRGGLLRAVGVSGEPREGTTRVHARQLNGM